MTKAMGTAIVYTRLSKEKKNNVSMAVQAAEGLAYCKRVGLTPLVVLGDLDVSAFAYPFLERPEAIRAFKLLQSKLASHLIVRTGDRLARDVSDGLSTVRRLRKIGSWVHVVHNPCKNPVNLTDPNSYFVFAIDQMLAEVYPIAISDKVRANKANRKENKIWYGQEVIGFKKVEQGSHSILVPREEDIQIAKKIQELRDSGLTWTQVSNQLNAIGMRNKRGDWFTRDNAKWWYNESKRRGTLENLLNGEPVLPPCEDNTVWVPEEDV